VVVTKLKEDDMLFTESEAKTKLCPTQHSVDPNNIQCQAHCSGSECMAWNWTDSKPITEKSKGYCGLAG